MKRRTASVFIAVFGVLALVAPVAPFQSAASAEPPGCAPHGEMVSCPDLRYGVHSTNMLGSTQRLDIYKPPGDGPFPVIVWLHGGAWTGGNRKEGFPVHDDWNDLERQVSRGYAVVSVDYRLVSTSVNFPTPLYDVKQAVRWLKWQSETYDLIPHKIALGGYSATATDGMIDYEPTSFGPGYGELANQTSTTELAIGYAGIYDFRRNLDIIPYYGWAVSDGASQLLRCDMPGGHPTDPIPIEWPDCTTADKLKVSPINHLRGAPLLLAHGDDDPIAEKVQAEEYHKARTDGGPPSVLRMIPDGGHGGTDTWAPNVGPYLDIMLEYYVRND
jgi:acetyl esterase/lipase